MKFCSQNILEIDNLSVYFDTDDGVVQAVCEASFDIPVRKTVALLGESGCGKTVTGRAILNLIDPPGRVVGGKIRLRSVGQDHNEDLIDILQLQPDGGKMRQLRWSKISMIFQDPGNSLTPCYTIGEQIIEAITLHQNVTRSNAREMAIDLLQQVGISAPERRFHDYPHQLSGGMCQRVMIAMALSCKPKLIIADEPTTALDVTIQAQVLKLLKQTQHTFEMSILLITHDMGVVAEMADEVVVMYLGRIMEKGPVEDIFNNPRHPYTKQLFASVPKPDLDRSKALSCIRGAVPDHLHLPQGCPFRGRCEEEMYICRSVPKLLELYHSHWVRCWLYQEDNEI